MIISASRRTDIPAFYSDWFMNRVREGWCQVPNPFNSNQLQYVSLKPQDVDAIVFWSKNATPMLPHLDELDERGFRYYFQFCVNDYSQMMEPNVPDLTSRIESFRKISEHVGVSRVVWRYDPIIISNRTPASFHVEKFSLIALALRGYTERVMVSFVDYYRKANLRLSNLERQGFEFDKEAPASLKLWDLMRCLSVTANINNIEIYTCAEENDFTEAGIPPGRCIDGRLLEKLWGCQGHSRKDPSQRDSCLCNVSKDIGVNDTCIHGCLYCYATGNTDSAKRRHSVHDPRLATMWGKPRELTEAERTGQYALDCFK